MEVIKDTVKNVIQDLITKKSATGIDGPEALLKKVLTRKELEHIRFSYFKQGVLGLYVDSSTWLYSLNLKKEDLLTKLGVKSKAIKDIRFRIGEVK